MREAVRGNGLVDKTSTAPRADFTTYTSALMRELIAARSWLTVFQLPAYAPELNPVEPVWSRLKRSMTNFVKTTLDQLIAIVKNRLKRIQHHPSLITGFLTETRLDLKPP